MAELACFICGLTFRDCPVQKDRIGPWNQAAWDRHVAFWKELRGDDTPVSQPVPMEWD